MNKSFNNIDGIKIIENMISVIQENKEYLSEIDGAIGDGDHGINMNKGFSMAKEAIHAKRLTLSEAFGILSMTLMEKIGGSMGPLYGSIFMGMQSAVANTENIDGNVVKDMFIQAYENIKMISPAKPGDKTLVDVLDPAVNAYVKTWEETSDIVTSLEACRKASTEGLLSTKNMQAKLGRASRLKEKSIGYQDAGATSCSLLINAFCDAVENLLK